MNESKQTQMRYGTLEEVAYWLDATACTEGELRAALMNLLSRIDRLERQLKTSKEAA
jgi:hypothetical protein